jgi:cation:H+ antiporter
MSLIVLAYLGLLGASILCLAYGADKLVHACCQLGLKLKISPTFIGLTILAIGTSLPEIVVTTLGVWEGQDGLAIGNIVGSNIFNIAAILGVTAIIAPIIIPKTLTKKEIPAVLALTLLLTIPLSNGWIISHWAGLLLLATSIPIVWLMSWDPNTKKVDPNELLDPKDIEESKKISLTKEILIILGASTLVYLGGKALILSATSLATLLGIEATIIGLSITAIGTGAPEVFTCIACALKKKPEMAIGNIVGSNIFNILLGIGLPALLFNIQTQALSKVDWSMQIVLTILFYILALQGKVNRTWGIVLVLLYSSYLVWLALQGS